MSLTSSWVTSTGSSIILSLSNPQTITLPPNNLHYEHAVDCLLKKSYSFLFCPKTYKQASFIFGDIILMNRKNKCIKKEKTKKFHKRMKMLHTAKVLSFELFFLAHEFWYDLISANVNSNYEKNPNVNTFTIKTSLPNFRICQCVPEFILVIFFIHFLLTKVLSITTIIDRGWR